MKHYPPEHWDIIIKDAKTNSQLKRELEEVIINE